MWRRLSTTEVYYSPLPPAELLQRLANRTATLAVNASGWGTTRRSQPFHEFEGSIKGNYFAISQLPADERQAYTFKAALGTQLSQVEGWLALGHAGGTLVQLRFHALLLPWWGVLVALLLFTWSKCSTLETWPTAEQFGQFLVGSGVLFLSAWVTRPLSLWVRIRRLRPALIRLFQLRPIPAT